MKSATSLSLLVVSLRGNLRFRFEAEEGYSFCRRIQPGTDPPVLGAPLQPPPSIFGHPFRSGFVKYDQWGSFHFRIPDTPYFGFHFLLVSSCKVRTWPVEKIKRFLVLISRYLVEFTPGDNNFFGTNFIVIFAYFRIRSTRILIEFSRKSRENFKIWSNFEFAKVGPKSKRNVINRSSFFRDYYVSTNSLLNRVSGDNFEN